MLDVSELKYAIRKKKLSQQELASKMGISRTALNKYLNGKSETNSDTFIKLIYALEGDIFIPGVPHLPEEFACLTNYQELG